MDKESAEYKDLLKQKQDNQKEIDSLKIEHQKLFDEHQVSQLKVNMLASELKDAKVEILTGFTPETVLQQKENLKNNQQYKKKPTQKNSKKELQKKIQKSFDTFLANLSKLDTSLAGVPKKYEVQKERFQELKDLMMAIDYKQRHKVDMNFGKSSARAQSPSGGTARGKDPKFKSLGQAQLGPM